MFSYERLDQIFGHINASEYTSVSKLTETLSISTRTLPSVFKQLMMKQKTMVL